ncbi:MAG: shikimate dehydrogenase [Candidatus Omnitrophota bacterium]
MMKTELYPKMTVDAHTHLYGIFGSPVRHSLSPLIHNTAFSHLKMNAAYVAFEMSKEQLPIAFEAVRALGIHGVNVTIPHKEAASNLVDEIPEDIDRSVGALNTVVNRNGRLFGYNTDGHGFLFTLREELGFNPAGKTVLVLGAGGSARSVVFALANAGAARILIHNRTQERAQGLADFLSGSFRDMEIEAVGSLDAVKGEKLDLAVNATSCGMKPEDPLPMDLKILRKGASVYDLIYAPAETKFLKEAGRLGFPRANGLGMLAAQAALSFGLWTGHTEGVRELMLETLKKCRF